MSRPSPPPTPSPTSAPPSPTSVLNRDVPLLRLDDSHSFAARDRSRRAFAAVSDNMTSGRASSTSSAGQQGFTPRERKQSNPLSQFRSNASLRSSVASSAATLKGDAASSAGGRSRGGYSGNPRGKDRYSDAPDEDDDLLGGGPPGLQGRGESDGEYDEGWVNGLVAEEEGIALLGGDKVSRRALVSSTPKLTLASLFAVPSAFATRQGRLSSLARSL
jgi:phospholipid-translocating ATPase